MYNRLLTLFCISVFTTAAFSQPCTPAVSTIKPDSVTRVSQPSGGSFNKLQTVTISGTHAYVTSNTNTGGLSIYDISNHQNPVLKGSVSTYGPVMAAVQGSYAYQGGSNSTVYVINVSNPDSPYIAGSVTPSGGVGSIYACAISGNYLYVASQNKGLIVINVSTPSSPSVAYTEGGTTNKCAGVAVVGNTVYTTNYQTASPWTVRYLKTWDVTTPSSPSLQSTYTITPSTFKPADVEIYGNFAYVADRNNNKVAIIDVTTPSSPSYLSSMTTTQSNNLEGATWVSGHYAYLFSGGTGGGGAIDIYDVTSKSSPVFVSTIATEPSGHNFGGGAGLSRYLYAADYNAGTSGYLAVYKVPKLTHNDTICYGDTAVLYSTGGASYAWSTGATTSDISVTTSGIYTVTVTNASSCTTVVADTVTVRAAPTVTSDTICTGATATLTASGGTQYAWAKGDTSASITTTSAGSYTVTVTTAYGCTAAISGVVVLKTLPTPSVNSAGICAGDTATLTATGGTGYVWSTAATTTSITTSTAGTYTITATGTNGCTASASGTVTVHANPAPHAGLDTTVNSLTNVTLGDTLPIGGTAPYVFHWSPATGLDDTTIRRPTAAPYGNTTYIEQATDSFGCKGNDTVIVHFDKSTDVLTVITYSAQNLHYDTVGGQLYVEFDVFATDSPAGLLYSQSEIFLQYDSTIFGTHLVDSNKVVATKGLAVDSPYYNLSLSDSTPTMIKIAITHTANPASLSNLSNANQQLCHLKVKLTGFNLTSVGAAFDTVVMAGRSKFKRSISSVEFPYDIIRVVDLRGASRSTNDPIAYKISNANYSSGSGKLIFNIDAESTSGYDFYSAHVVVNYSEYNFGTNVATSNLTCHQTLFGDDGSNPGGTGQAIYGAPTISNYSSSSFQVEVNASNSYYDITSPVIVIPSIYYYTTIATCSLTVVDCLDSGSTGYLFIDAPHSSGELALDTQSFQEYGSYDTVINGGGFTNGGSNLCTRAPSVYGQTPDCINAGSFEVFTIYGHDFGVDTGTVWFNNADSNGTYIPTQKQDISLWTNDQIQLLIPTSPATAAAGGYYIETAVGLDDQTEGNVINIGYASFNTRLDGVSPSNPDYGKAEFVFLQDTPFVFKLDTTLFNTPGAIAAIQHVMADMNCQTGINFQLDTTAPSLITTPQSLDHVNLISIQPYTSSIFPHQDDLAFTSLGSRFQSCNPGLPQYNNFADYMFDIDISIKNVPPGTSTWLWSDATTPTAGQVDFATVIIHELGHAAMLNHTLPARRVDGNVMNPYTPIGNKNRTFAGDPNDILGIKHMLDLGVTLGTTGGCPYATQVFPSGCPTVTPSACVPVIYGVDDLTSGSSTFNAYLYPNPYETGTIIHIDVLQYSDFTITMYDVLGQLILYKDISSGTSFDIPLSNLAESAGMYLIKVSDLHNNKVLKLIKL